jgi:hypothetical protein
VNCLPWKTDDGGIVVIVNEGVLGFWTFMDWEIHVQPRPQEPTSIAFGRATGRQRQLHSAHEIDDQSNEKNGSKNAAAEIHELLLSLI